MYMKNILLFSACLLLGACSPRIPFTQQIRDEYQLTADELKGIQFYLSDQVKLKKGEVASNRKSMEDGKLVIVSGKDIDVITFRLFTPGAVDQVVDAQTLRVAFEEGPERTLVFSSSKIRSGYYHLSALDWDNGLGKINYGGQTWFSSRGSDKAILLFKMKSIRNLRVNEKVVKGRKLN